MTLPDFDPATGLWGLGLFSFLAATVLPGGSELALYTLLRADPGLLWPALMMSTVGNTLGGLFSWWCGQKLPARQRLEALSQVSLLRRWGSPALLLSWVPLIGDALCVAAGWLGMAALPCTLFMAIGKFARYALVAHGAL